MTQKLLKSVALAALLLGAPTLVQAKVGITNGVDTSMTGGTGSNTGVGTGSNSSVTTGATVGINNGVNARAGIDGTNSGATTTTRSETLGNGAAGDMRSSESLSANNARNTAAAQDQLRANNDVLAGGSGTANNRTGTDINDPTDDNGGNGSLNRAGVTGTAAGRTETTGSRTSETLGSRATETVGSRASETTGSRGLGASGNVSAGTGSTNVSRGTGSTNGSGATGGTNGSGAIGGTNGSGATSSSGGSAGGSSGGSSGGSGGGGGGR